MKAIAAVPAHEAGVSRRGFLVTALGGLSIGFFLPDGGHVVDLEAQQAAQQQINAWIRIGTDNSITLEFGGCEMGQGAKSGLAQILAEELMVDWGQITVEQSLANPAVSYTTGGSSAVSKRFMPLRNAAAAAREMLIAAAMQLNGDSTRANYAAASATVIYQNGAKTWTYGELAVAAASIPVPANPPLTPAAQYRLIGKALPRVDIPSKVDGSAQYGIDVRLPGMVYAVIKHCPTIGGVLASTPSKPSGAIAVVPCKASDTRGIVAAGSVNAVAVVATDTWTAKKMVSSLRVHWTLPPTASIDSATLAAQAQQLLASGTPLIAEPAGATQASAEAAVSSALSLAAKTVDSTYTLPYLAHATMEVLNCTVSLTSTSCEVWAPTQSALSVVHTVSALTGLPSSAITVHTTYLGGGLGRKIEQDYISQAVQVAMAIHQPVKLMWTREEDFSHDQYRPMAVVQGKAGVDSVGNIVGWYYRNVSSSILGQHGYIGPGVVDSQATEGATGLPYQLGQKVTEWVVQPAGIPVGFWRSVGCSINAFAVESLIDELAVAANMDPFAFRYQNMTLDPRATAVLQAADALSLWRKSLPKGHAWGVAIAEAFGTWVCEVVDISGSATSIRVNRVACVVDCGQVINPGSVEMQMQGGIVHGLNAALWGQITFAAGVSSTKNFNGYRMLRAREMPAVTVRVMPGTAPPSGIGEPGVPPIAPAVANAFFRLTGIRQRNLPFFPGARTGDD